MFDSQRNQAYLTELLNWAQKIKQVGWENGHQLHEEHTRSLNVWQYEMDELIQEIRYHLRRPNHSTPHGIYPVTGKTAFRPTEHPGTEVTAEQIVELEQRASMLYHKLMDLLAKKSSQPFSQAFNKGKKESTEHLIVEVESSSSYTDYDEETVPRQSVPIGEHRLPPLPYAYNALEPFIAEEIMRLHHTKHHQSYVDGLNKAERKMLDARRTGDFDLIKHWEREAAFHGSGHYLHTIFWHNMKPKGGGAPSGKLADEINKSFGSFERFKKHFTEAADKVEGVGWAILVWAPRAQRLEILQADKHQHFAQWDVIPLLVLDVWEHAYYLQYKTDKRKYIENWWNLVNWKNVSHRLKEAEAVRWHPY